ncbi:MAG: Cna B-type domain-containing protein [Bifidobacteriaceae bacterium]|jgi:hypothetical protein|nr:Cna B-type domain-containing protein [Bifidobacteriaceae bacterium]
MKKQSKSLILSTRARAYDKGAKIVAFIAALAAIVSSIFAMGSATSANAAGAISITQSNDAIVLGNSSKDSNSIKVRVSVEPNDVVTITLDHRLWNSDTWLSNFPYGTLDKNAASNTATFTFPKMTSAQIVTIPVTVSPSISHSEVATPLSDTAKAALVTEGAYTLSATIASTDKTTSTQSATFSVTDGKYSTGTSWTNTVSDFGLNSSYVKGTAYTFSLPSTLGVQYAADSLEHPSWITAKTQITLNVPGGFSLDAAASPGWTQNSSGTISFNPTVAGATTRFTGTFTASAGTYNAKDNASGAPSTISGYFGSSSALQKLTLATPLSVKVVEATAAPSATIMKANDATSNLAPLADPDRPGIVGNTYSNWYGISVPATSQENFKDASVQMQAADGSYLSSGTVTLSTPIAGTVITASLLSESGLTKTVTYSVTAADVTAKLATVTLPDASDGGWVQTTAKATSLAAGGNLKLNFTAAGQNTLRDGTTTADGTVKASSATVSATSAVSGVYYSGSYTSDTAAGTAGTKVTYKRVALVNNDLTLQVEQWRSPSLNTFDTKNNRYPTYGENTTRYMYPSMYPDSGASSTTAQSIYEPVMYFMLARKTVFLSTYMATGIPRPAVSSYQLSTGQTVVKLDWSNTGWWYNTKTYGYYNNPSFGLTWRAASSGVDTVSPAALWISNRNDTSLTLGHDGGAIQEKISDDLAKEVTKDDYSTATLMGSMNVKVINAAGYSGFSSTMSVTDNQGKVSAAMASDKKTQMTANALTPTTTADHTINLDVMNASSGTVSNIGVLLNLPDNLSLKLTGPVTITRADGTVAKVTDSDVTVLYSLSTQTAAGNSGGLGGIPGSAFAANQSLWDAVRSIYLMIPTSAAQSEYQVSIPVTDDNAHAEAGTWATLTATTYSGGTVATGGTKASTATVKDSYALMEGVKNWDDDNDATGQRPSSIDVNLLDASGKTVETQKVDQWSAWQYGFTDASPIDSSGNFIKYTVSEASVPSGYKASYDGFDITNTSTSLLSMLPFTGGTGYSYTTLALSFAGIALAAGGVAIVASKRAARKRGIGPR